MQDEFDHLLDDKGQIKTTAIGDLLIEVISGKSLFHSEGELYATRGPLMAEQDNARIVHIRKLHETRKRGLPTRSEIEADALRLGALDQDDRDEMANLELLMQRQQKARELTRDHMQKAQLADEIEKVRGKLIEMRMREEEIFCHSAEAKAEEARINFLISCCTLGGELLDELVWRSWKEYQDSDRWRLLLDARRAFMRVSHGLPIKIIRAVARSQEWKGRWKASREAGSPLFDGSGADWDINKRNLAWWSEFYEAIARHPEAPPDDVLNNDDALQDWVNQQVARKNGLGSSGSTGRPPPTYLDGKGQRHQMARIGSEQIAVRTPFKVRV